MTCITAIIMLTITHHYYLPDLPLSLPYLRIQFTKIHLIYNLPSLSSFPTYLLLILIIFTQNLHDLIDTSLCRVVCKAVYSQWWICVRLYLEL